MLLYVFGVFLVTGDDGTTFCFFYRQDLSENNIFIFYLLHLLMLHKLNRDRTPIIPSYACVYTIY